VPIFDILEVYSPSSQDPSASGILNKDVAKIQSTRLPDGIDTTKTTSVMSAS